MAIHTRWCPSSLAKLVQKTPIKPMVYGRYNELVFMGFINQQTSLGGTILYPSMGPVEIVEAFASFRERGLSFRGDILL